MPIAFYSYIQMQVFQSVTGVYGDLLEMLEHLGLELEGRHHSGIGVLCGALCFNMNELSGKSLIAEIIVVGRVRGSFKLVTFARLSSIVNTSYTCIEL